MQKPDLKQVAEAVKTFERQASLSLEDVKPLYDLGRYCLEHGLAMGEREIAIMLSKEISKSGDIQGGTWKEIKILHSLATAIVKAQKEGGRR